MPGDQRRSVSIRPLSAAQAVTRHRLLDATKELATEGGYEAVGMSEVAERAGVSPATAYVHFASRDHLLMEVLAELLAESTTAIRSECLENAEGPMDRVVALITVVGGAVQNFLDNATFLHVALMRAYLASAQIDEHARDLLVTAIGEWIGIALEDSDMPEVDALGETIQYVCFGAMVAVATGQRTPSEISGILERAARTFLGG